MSGAYIIELTQGASTRAAPLRILLCMMIPSASCYKSSPEATSSETVQVTCSIYGQLCCGFVENSIITSPLWA